MKLLGWMNRKFRQNNGDVFKDYNTAKASSCNCLCVPSSPEEFHRHRRRPQGFHGMFTETEGGGVEDVLFEGLLAIGTLGSRPSTEMNEEEEEEVEPAVVEAVTVEAIAEKEADAATEEELMVVGAELEKVLLAEAEKEDVSDRLSSARPSHVGIKGSAVTGCPLQGYLFGSSVDSAYTAGRRRASLGELFMMSGVAEDEGKSVGKGEENSSGRCSGGAKPTTGIQLVMMKKMLRGGGGSRKSSGAGSGPEANPAASTKFNKILKIFHRKVHPENSIVQKKPKKYHKYKNKEDCSPTYAGNDFDGENGGRDALTNSCRNEGSPSLKSHSIGGSSASFESREYWIKTDSEYLVLEL